MRQPGNGTTSATGPRIAFQGVPGAYSESAIGRLWPDGATSVPMRTCLDVTRAVAFGAVDAGVLPIENSIAGAVTDSHDALAATPELLVVAETLVPIRHALLAVPHATLDGLHTIESHPVALAQCRRFLAAHPTVSARATEDTAGAAVEIAAAGDPRRGAVASAALAERLGLQVLAAEIEDRPDNQTRFVALVRPQGAVVMPDVPAASPAVLSLLVDLADGVADLGGVLTLVSEAGFTVRGVAVRPSDEPWTYRAGIELLHPSRDAAVGPLLDRIRARARSVRVLGTFAPADADADAETPARPADSPLRFPEERAHG